MGANFTKFTQKKVDEIIKFSKIKIGVYDKSFGNKKIFKIKKIKIYELSYLSKLRPSDKFLDFKNINKNDISCIFLPLDLRESPKG